MINNAWKKFSFFYLPVFHLLVGKDVSKISVCDLQFQPPTTIMKTLLFSLIVADECPFLGLFIEERLDESKLANQRTDKSNRHLLSRVEMSTQSGFDISIN